MSRKSKMEQGKITFQVSETLQATAKDLTYLLISKLHGYNNGTPREYLFDDFGLSDEQYSLIFNMWLSYLLVYPEMNSFQTALYQIETKAELIDAIDLFKDYNMLPETLHKQEERLDIKLKHIEAIKIANRAKELEKQKKIQEKYNLFENTFENPKNHEEVTYSYTTNTSPNSEVSEKPLAF